MKKVLVIGGGVGGIEAALELANLGHYVYLVEKSPFLGGLIPSLLKTYPVCFYCNFFPKLSECENHFNIQTLTQTQIKDIEGQVGQFKVKAIRESRYIDMNKCTSCGLCAEQCPQEIDYPFNGSLRKRKAVYLPHPWAIPHKYVIDKNACLFFKDKSCRKCEEVCPVQAINLGTQSEELELEVDSVIFAAGASLSDPAICERYHYLSLPNVITGMELECLLKDSIKLYGHLVRPSDKKRVKKVAWLQCVGSRELNKDKCGYCSSVCCMYALKEALISRKTSDVEATIFFMDLRAYGKYFEEYYQKAKDLGIRFVRSRVHALSPSPEEGNVIVKYADENGDLIEEEFDLVSLSVGFHPSADVVAIAQKLGVNLNKYHFVETTSFTPVQTSRPGVYVCGVFQEPKDILDTTTQSSAAVAEVTANLNTLSSSKKMESPVAWEEKETKIGVFLCQCLGTISEVIDLEAISQELQADPEIAFCDIYPSLCSLEGRKFIQEKIKELGLSRILIGACSPKLYELHFQALVKEAGVCPYLMEMANLREQCAWPHLEQRELATQKAKALVKMALAKLRLDKAIRRQVALPFKSILVVGGGIAGLVAALQSAKLGFEVYLVEKAEQLGGIVNKIHLTWKGEDAQAYLKNLLEEVTNHPRIHIYTKAEVVDSSGQIGHFKTSVKTSSGIKHIEHGAIILASGAEGYRPKEYLYGKHSRVLTSLELQQKIFQQAPEVINAQKVVFIQCVGSRNNEHPYCSRICCTQTMKNALLLKERNPQADIYVLYRDIRTYGFKEDLYREARAKGIVFVRYDVNDLPRVEMLKRPSGRGFLPKLRVEVNDSLLKKKLILDADIVALATGIVSREDNRRLAQIFHVPIDEHGFFKEDVRALSAVNSMAEGVFVCGLAQGPKFIDESIAQAMATASKAAQILYGDQIELTPFVSEVIDENCDGCGYCVEACPFKALRLVEYMNQGEVKKVAEVNVALCQGCGVCQATCPKNGIQVANFRLDQFSAMIEAALETV